MVLLRKTISVLNSKKMIFGLYKKKKKKDRLLNIEWKIFWKKTHTHENKSMLHVSNKKKTSQLVTSSFKFQNMLFCDKENFL